MKCPSIALTFALTVGSATQGQTPAESIQLQKLILNSEQQLKTLREILEVNHRDADAIVRTARLLENLSAGLDRSIEAFKGTDAYAQALLRMQTESAQKLGFQQPTADEKRLRDFQQQTISANRDDLEDQRRLAERLSAAEPGFVPKLQAQAALGDWRSNTRLSIQMAELLASIQILREDLKARSPGGAALAALVEGAEVQNRKQREGVNHGK